MEIRIELPNIETSYSYDNEEMCSICHDAFGNHKVFALCCDHKFHQECIVRYMSQDRNPSCPLCRGEVRIHDTSSENIRHRKCASLAGAVQTIKDRIITTLVANIHNLKLLSLLYRDFVFPEINGREVLADHNYICVFREVDIASTEFNRIRLYTESIQRSQKSFNDLIQTLAYIEKVLVLPTTGKRNRP